MVELYEIYGLQMGASQALEVLRRTQQFSKLDARRVRSVLDSKAERIPDSLRHLMQPLYLMQLRPANSLPL